MATTLKTISYAFDMVTSVIANNTLTALNQITIVIPENVIAFNSVFLEVGFQDIITVTGGTIGNSQVDLQLQGAGAPTSQTIGAVAQTGENIALIYGPLDYTAHFTTNWTGTSRTCDVSVLFNQTTGTTLGMINVTAILHITYSYDDDVDINPVQIKTVRIPFASPTAGLPTASNSFFGEIPSLENFTPEAARDIMSYHFIFEANEGTVSTNDFTVSMSIDGGATYNFGTQERALNSDRWCRWVYNNSLASVPDPAVEHNLELWSTIANTCNCMVVTMVVTYTYDAVDTTRVCNSVYVPLEFASPLGRATVGDASKFTREIMVSESGTITFIQSAFRVNFNTLAATTTLWRAGNQSFTSYAITAAQVCGMMGIQQRIDGGSNQGAGMTLTRGANNIVIEGYTTTGATIPITNINGYILLNYISDLSSMGEGAHNKTVFSNMKAYNSVATAALWNDITYALPIPQSNYYLTSSAVVTVLTPPASCGITLDLKLLAGENKGSGYLDIYTDTLNTDPEVGTTYAWFRCGSAINKFPQAVKRGADIEETRVYRLQQTTAFRSGCYMAATYHSLTWTLAGDFIGTFDPALPTELHLQRRDTMEIEQVQNLSAGVDDYSFTVYNDVIEYRVIAFQDSTHVATTAWGTAT